MDSATLQIIISAIDEASASIAKISDSLKELGGMADDANAEIADTSKGAAAGIDDISVASKGALESVLGLRDVMVESTAAMGKNTESLLANSAALEKSSAANVEKGASSFSKLGMGATIGAAVIGYAIDKTVKSYANLQTQMTKLVTSAGESSKNLNMVTAGVQNVARTTGTSTTDLGNAMYYIESAGFHGAAGLKLLMASAKGAKDEQASAMSVADAASTIINNYGRKNVSAAQAVNGMITAVSRGKTTLQLFSTSLATVLPIAASAHLSFAQVAGAISTMTAAGMTAQRSTQNLRQAITSMQNPSQQQMITWQQLGINVVDVTTKLGQRGLTGTLKILKDAVDKNTTAGKTYMGVLMHSQSANQDLKLALDKMTPSLRETAQAYLDGSISSKTWRTDLYNLTGTARDQGLEFNTLISNARGFSQQIKQGAPDTLAYDAALKKVMGTQAGMQVALMLSANNFKTVDSNVKAVQGTMKSASDQIEGWSNMQGTFNQQMSQLKEDFITLGQQIGKALIPMLTAAAKLLADFFKPIADLITKFPAVSAVILIAAGSILTFIAAMLGIAKATKYVQDAWKEFKHLTEVTKVQALWSKIVAVAQWAWTAATNALTGATLAFNAALDAMGIGEILLLIGLVIAALIAVGTGIYELIKHWKDVKKFGVDAWHDIENAWNAAPKFFENLWHDVENTFTNTINWLKNHWKEVVVAILIGPIGDAVVLIIRNWNTITKAFSDVWNRIKSDAKQWGKDVVKGIVDGLEALANYDINSIINIAQQATEAYQDALKYGKKIIDGIKAGWDIGFRNAKHWGMDLIHDIGGAITTSYQTVFKWGRDIIDGVKNGFMGTVRDAPKWGKDVIKGIINGFNNAVKDIVKFFTNLPDTLKASVMDSGKKTAQHSADGFSGIWKDNKTMTKIGKDILLGILIAIGAVIGAIVGLFLTLAITIVNALIWGLKNGFKLLTQLGSWVLQEIDKGIGDASTWLYQTGKDIIDGLTKGIKDETTHAVNAVKDVGSSVESGLKGLLGIHSPSTVFAEVGQNIDEGLKQGITGNKQGTQQAAKDLGTSTITGVKEGVSSAGSITASTAGGTAGVGIGNVTIEIKDSIFTMNQSQAQQLATQIYQALQQIARTHGASNALPSIGIRPI